MKCFSVFSCLYISNIPFADIDSYSILCFVRIKFVVEKNGNAPGQRQLHKVDVPTMTNSQCQYFLGRNNVHSSNLCAGDRYGGKDACQV